MRRMMRRMSALRPCILRASRSKQEKKGRGKGEKEGGREKGGF
jgi:hypothetical protein